MNTSATNSTAAGTGTPELNQVTALSNDFAEETSNSTSLNIQMSSLLSASTTRQVHSHLTNNHGGNNSWYTSMLLGTPCPAGSHHQQLTAGDGLTSSAKANLMSSAACDDALGQIMYDESTAPVNVNWSSSETSLMADHDEATASNSLWAAGQHVFMSSAEQGLHEMNPSCTMDGLQDVLSYPHEQDLKQSMGQNVISSNENIWDDHQLTNSGARCSYLVGHDQSALMINSCTSHDDDSSNNNDNVNSNASNASSVGHHHLNQHGWPSSSSNNLRLDSLQLLPHDYQQLQSPSTIFQSPSSTTHTWIHGFSADRSQKVHSFNNHHNVAQDLVSPPMCVNKLPKSLASPGLNLNPSGSRADNIAGVVGRCHDYWPQNPNINLNVPQCVRSMLLQNPSLMTEGKTGNHVLQAKAISPLSDSQQRMLINNMQRASSATHTHHGINVDNASNFDSKRPINTPSTMIDNNSSNQDSNPGYNNPSSLKRSRADQATASPAFKQPVRKEKLGERITVLQQLVSPFGKTDTASVLLEAIGRIKFLQEQFQMLSSPYMKNGNDATNTGTVKESTSGSSTASGGSSEAKSDLRSKGLCLVPLSSILHLANDINGADRWTSPYNGSSLLR